MANWYIPRPNPTPRPKPNPEPPRRDVIDRIVDGGKRIIGGFLPPAINNRIGGGGSGGYRPPVSSSATRPRQPSTPSYQAPTRGNSYYGGGGKTFTRNQNGSITVSRADGTSNTWAPNTYNHNFARRTLEKSGGSWDALKYGLNDNDENQNPVVEQARPPISPSATRYDPSQEVSRFFGSMDDAHNARMGKGPRPDPYVRPGATIEDIVRMAENRGEQYGNDIADREFMGSAEEAQIMANNKRFEAMNEKYARDKERVRQMGDQQSNEAWVNFLRGKASLGEMLALQGINGGATESAYLSQGNAYENSLQGIRQNTSNQLADIDTQLRQHEFERDAQNAEIRAQQEMRREELRQQEKNRILERALQMANMALGQERWQREFDLGLENRDYQRGLDSRDWDFKMRGYDDSRSDASWERAMAEKKFGLEQGRYDMDKKMFGLEYGLAKKKLDNYGQGRSGGRGRSVAGGRGGGSVGTGSLSLADTGSRVIPRPLNLPYKPMNDQYKAAVAENAKRRALQVEQDYKAGRISTQEYIAERDYLDEVARNFGY